MFLYFLTGFEVIETSFKKAAGGPTGNRIDTMNGIDSYPEGSMEQGTYSTVL